MYSIINSTDEDGNYLNFWIYVGLIVVVKSINDIIFNKTFTWTFDDSKLIIKSGFLPWKKSYYTVPIEDVYEACLTQSTLSNILGRADIVIRKTDGVSSTVVQNLWATIIKLFSQ